MRADAKMFPLLVTGEIKFKTSSEMKPGLLLVMVNFFSPFYSLDPKVDSLNIFLSLVFLPL